MGSSGGGADMNLVGNYEEEEEEKQEFGKRKMEIPHCFAGVDLGGREYEDLEKKGNQIYGGELGN